MYTFRLYVTGKAPKSMQIEAALKAALKDIITDEGSFEIIDLLESPHSADQDNVFATPTLVKASPLPSKKIIGDFSDIEKVLVGLDVGL